MRLSRVQRIFVLRALYLGDMLCAVPALRALRHAAPEAEIVLGSLPWAQEFAKRYSAFIDQFVEVPGFPGLPEQLFEPRDVVSFLSHLQRYEFDLAIQMHGSGANTNALVMLVGAKQTVGFYPSNGYCPDSATFLPYPTEDHEITRNLRIVEFLGANSRSNHLELPIHDEDRQRLRALDGAESLEDADYICIHVGAKLSTRRWAPERFAAVANELAADGYQIVLTGSQREQALVSEVERAIGTACVNLCGQTDLGMLAALVHGARLLISNDTGVAHVSAAVRTASVIIVLSSDSRRWAPLDTHRHRIVSSQVDCRPCEHVACPIGFTCAEQVTTADVLSAAREQLCEQLPLVHNDMGGAILSPSINAPRACLQ